MTIISPKSRTELCQIWKLFVGGVKQDLENLVFSIWNATLFCLKMVWHQISNIYTITKTKALPMVFQTLTTHQHTTSGDMHHFWAMWKQQHLTHRQAKNCPIRWLSFPLNQGQNYAKFENFLLEGWNKIWRTWCFQFGMPPSSALKWSDTNFQTYTQSQKLRHYPLFSNIDHTPTHHFWCHAPLLGHVKTTTLNTQTGRQLLN